MSDKRLFGWRVRCDIPLPDLLDWNGDDRVPDVQFTVGAVQEGREHWRSFSPAARLGPAGELLLCIPNVAAYLVEGGSRVTIEPFLPITAPDIRAFLLGTVLATLCFNRGMMPLHASGVATPRGALLMSGNSGLGKSTLAATLHRCHGFPLISDDMCALDFQNRETPVLWPAFPRLKLWKDSAQSLQMSTAGAERTREEFDKFHIPVSAQDFHADPLPFAALILLNRSLLPTEPQVTRLGGFAALQRRDMVHRWILGEALGHGPLIFRGLTSLVRAVPVLELTRSDDLDAVPELAARIVALVSTAP